MDHTLINNAFVNRPRRAIVPMALMASLGLTQTHVFAQESMVEADEVVVTESVSARAQMDAVFSWTRARIAAAEAMELPVDTGFGGDAPSLEDPPVMGPEQSTPPGTAAPGALDIARAVYAEDWAALEAELARGDAQAPLDEEIELDMPADIQAGTAGVYTSYDVNTHTALWQIYPHRWDGKLTFVNANGNDSSCSATVISGNNIVTAAHCVYDANANQFHTSKAFTPAYGNGNAPYGTFPTAACSIPTAYANLSGSYAINTWARHDVAVCTMATNSAGQTINNAVGWAGRLANAGNSQLVFNSGYPARTYTDAVISNGPAQYLRACTAETFLETTETLGSGCNWGRGISGGSWLVGYKPFVVAGRVNSVNSGLRFDQQNLYGARFNSNNIVPLCNARGC